MYCKKCRIENGIVLIVVITLLSFVSCAKNNEKEEPAKSPTEEFISEIIQIEESTSDDTVTKEPTTEAPTTTEIPTTELLTTEEPTTPEPTTAIPTTEAPTTAVPTTEAPKGLNGYNSQTYSNGDTYYGNFVNGIRSGQGTYTWADGIIYAGEFVNGEPSGNGSYIYPTTEPPTLDDFYVGEYGWYDDDDDDYSSYDWENDYATTLTKDNIRDYIDFDVNFSDYEANGKAMGTANMVISTYSLKNVVYEDVVVKINCNVKGSGLFGGSWQDTEVEIKLPNNGERKVTTAIEYISFIFEVSSPKLDGIEIVSVSGTVK